MRRTNRYNPSCWWDLKSHPLVHETQVLPLCCKAPLPKIIKIHWNSGFKITTKEKFWLNEGSIFFVTQVTAGFLTNSLVGQSFLLLVFFAKILFLAPRLTSHHIFFSCHSCRLLGHNCPFCQRCQLGQRRQRCPFHQLLFSSTLVHSNLFRLLLR